MANIIIGFSVGVILTAAYGLLCWAATEATARRTDQAVRRSSPQEDPP
jgi:hypothetical protein